MPSIIMTKILFEYTDFAGEYALEGAWAEPSEAGTCRLDNILFYAPGYALGDTVAVEERFGEWYVTGLVTESGHSTVRVLFAEENAVGPTRVALRAMGCDSELSNLPNLVAVDIPSSVSYAEIKQFLEDGEQANKWEYEEACLAHSV